MVLNDTKTFVTKDLGVFCERFLTVDGAAFVPVQGVLSLRALVERRKDAEGFHPSVAIRRYLWSKVGDVRYDVLRRIERAYAIKYRISMGEIAYLPCSLGGAEALPRHLSRPLGERLGTILTSIHDAEGGSDIPNKVRIVLAWLKLTDSRQRELVCRLKETDSHTLWSFQREENHEVVRLLREIHEESTAMYMIVMDMPALEEHGFRAFERALRKSCRVWKNLPTPQARHLTWSVMAARRLLSRLRIVDSTLIPRGHATGRFGRKPNR
jgi:hypothetical protein